MHSKPTFTGKPGGHDHIALGCNRAHATDNAATWDFFLPNPLESRCQARPAVPWRTTSETSNLDFFRVDPCVPWLENWFPMDMQTAFGTVVCRLAIPHDPDEHPCCGTSQENHSAKGARMCQPLPLGV